MRVFKISFVSVVWLLVVAALTAHSTTSVSAPAYTGTAVVDNTSFDQTISLGAASTVTGNYQYAFVDYAGTGNYGGAPTGWSQVCVANGAASIAAFEHLNSSEEPASNAWGVGGTIGGVYALAIGAVANSAGLDGSVCNAPSNGAATITTGAPKIGSSGTNDFTATWATVSGSASSLIFSGPDNLVVWAPGASAAEGYYYTGLPTAVTYTNGSGTPHFSPLAAQIAFLPSGSAPTPPLTGTASPTPTSAASASPVPTPLPSDTVPYTDSSWIFSRTTVPSTDWLQGGTVMYSDGCVYPPQTATTVQGPMATINFTGTGITLYGQTGPNFGIGAYAIDGGSLQTADAYNSAGGFPIPLVSMSGLANESHVFTYQVTCNKNANSSAYYQALTTYTVEGEPNELSDATSYSYVNGNVTFGGSGWQCGGPGNAQDISGGHCWDGTAGDYVEWTFTGSLIEVFIRPDTGDGYFDVQIDGNTVAHDVSGQYTTVDNDQLDAWMAFAQSGLSAGQHTIKLIIDGDAPYPSESETSGLQNLLQFDVGLAFP